MPERPDVVPLLVPREAVPPLVDDRGSLDACLAALAAGDGPLAVDAERAGGYRYSQRAYLIQLRRHGSGTWLIDPIALPDLSAIVDVVGDTEWVVHAAGQDLPSLREVGMLPPALFDTELAGRLLGLERVGLSPMLEETLGVTLAKAHSAADWSTRPLPEPWLNYAALDVELLLELRVRLVAQLAEGGRTEWARQEFEYVRTLGPAPPRTEPWRRVKGLRTRSPRGLAIVREVWVVRDELARQRDVTPSRLLHDNALAAMADQPPTDLAGIRRLPRARGQTEQTAAVWLAAIERAVQLPEADLPAARAQTTEPPNPRVWERINPTAAARHDRIKELLTARADELGIDRENLMPPRALRTFIWGLGDESEAPSDPALVAGSLSALGVRDWQLDLALDDVLTGLAAQSEEPTTPAEAGITRE